MECVGQHELPYGNRNGPVPCQHTTLSVPVLRKGDTSLGGHLRAPPDEEERPTPHARCPPDPKDALGKRKASGMKSHAGIVYTFTTNVHTWME